MIESSAYYPFTSSQKMLTEENYLSFTELELLYGEPRIGAEEARSWNTQGRAFAGFSETGRHLCEFGASSPKFYQYNPGGRRTCSSYRYIENCFWNTCVIAVDEVVILTGSGVSGCSVRS